MGILRPNGNRAKKAISLIWVVLVFEMLSLISSYLQYDLLRSSNGNLTEQQAALNDFREQVIAILSLLVYVISVVTFIQWFRRAYYNLHQKVDKLSFAEGWAAGAWFVPIICLFRPYQIMNELYEKTIQVLNENGIEPIKKISSKFIGYWWALWIFNSVIGQILFRGSLKAESIEQLIFVTVISMALNITGIPLAFAAIKVIKDYSSIEHHLLDLVEEEIEIEDW